MDLDRTEALDIFVFEINPRHCCGMEAFSRAPIRHDPTGRNRRILQASYDDTYSAVLANAALLPNPPQHPTENGPGLRSGHKEVLVKSYGLSSERLQRPYGIAEGKRANRLSRSTSGLAAGRSEQMGQDDALL